MWERRTFPECAQELQQISDEFRSAWSDNDEKAMRRVSVRGVELLRVIALAVRSEQDGNLLPKRGLVIGNWKRNANESDIKNVVTKFDSDYVGLNDFQPLDLREALNKIAHADFKRTNFFLDQNKHIQILCNEYQGTTWVALISIGDLCTAMMSLPDRMFNSQGA